MIERKEYMALLDNPLQAIQDHYPKYLLTMDNDPEVLHDGIRQIYVLDWLVEGC